MAETLVEGEIKDGRGGAREGAGRKRTKPEPTEKDVAGSGKLTPAQSGVEFFDLLKTFDDGEWKERIIMNLYRLAPITDRTKTGNFKYLQKYLKPIEVDDVMREFGSGGYRLLLTRFDPVTRNTALLRQHEFDIENQDFPPKVPFGEWMDDDRNKKWAWAKPALLAQQQNAYAANGVGGNMNTDPVAMFKSAVDAVGKLRPETNDKERTDMAKMVIEEIRANRDYERKSNDPGQMLAIVKLIVDSTKPQPVAAGMGDGLTALMMQQLKAAQDMQTMLLTKLLDSEKHKGPTTLETLKELKEAVGLFRGNGGGSREAETTGWDVVTELGKKALDVLGFGFQFYLSRMGMRPQNPQPRQPAGDVQVVDAQPILLSPEEQANMVKGISDQYGQMFDDITPMLVDHFHNFDGLDFREWFKGEYGMATYRGVRQMNKQTFIDVIELRKKIAPEPLAMKLRQLAPPEALDTFIDDFLSDRVQQDDDDEGDPEPDEVAEPPKAKAAPKEF